MPTRRNSILEGICMSKVGSGAPRRWVAFLLIAVLTTMMAGYLLRSKAPSEEAQVRATVRAFMLARLTRDDAKVRRFLTMDMHREYVSQSVATLVGEADPHYHRYHIMDAESQADGTWTVSVRMEEHMTGFVPVGWFIESITLVPIDGVFRVDSVTQGAYHAIGKRR